jgi:FKBP-type peptidyl-prolyl isomerase-like protein
LKSPVERSALLVVSAAILMTGCLTACDSHSGSHGSASASASSPTSSSGPAKTNVGVIVSGGGFGTNPTLTIPASAAPTGLTQQVLTTGTGPAVVAGDTLIANYVGQTWAPKSGNPNVFDSSFKRGQAAAFVIGKGAVIPGWDKTLVGKRIGSRVLLTIPPADGYGTSGQSSANISGSDTLVFVVDLVASFPPNASASGSAVRNVELTGLPTITGEPGKEPKITSVAGVKAPHTPKSTLLVAGNGPKIDTKKTLVMQLVETDIATGTHGQSSWNQAPQTAAASSVLTIADKLTGQNIGSRVVVLLPAAAANPSAGTQATPASILVIDVVGQF